MRIITRKELMALPAGTVWSYYEPCVYRGLHIKDSEPTRFVFAVYWKGWYPFYDIKTASPLGHGYTEITAKQYRDFVRLATTTAGKI